MTVIIGGYSTAIFTNVLLMWATGTGNKWLILPWIVYYILLIFALLCSAPMIIIWFVWLRPAPIWALLSLASIAVASILIYFFAKVLKFFSMICNDRVKTLIPLSAQDSQDQEEKF